MRTPLTGLLVACVAATAWAGSAFAAPPERFHSSDPGSEEPGFVHCDGFDIDLATSGSEDLTVYLHGSGAVVKVLVRSRARDIFTNTATGETVVNRGVFQHSSSA